MPHVRSKHGRLQVDLQNTPCMLETVVKLYEACRAACQKTLDKKNVDLTLAVIERFKTVNQQNLSFHATS